MSIFHFDRHGSSPVFPIGITECGELSCSSDGTVPLWPVPLVTIDAVLVIMLVLYPSAKDVCARHCSEIKKAHREAKRHPGQAPGCGGVHGPDATA